MTVYDGLLLLAAVCLEPSGDAGCIPTSCVFRRVSREANFILIFENYDDFGQLVIVESPDSGVTRYQYDLAGNLEERVEANGRTTGYAYDSRNRLTEEEHTQSGLTTVTITHHYGSSNVDLTGSGVGTTTCTGPDFDPSGHKGRLAYSHHDAGGTYYSYNTLGEVVTVFEQPSGETDPCNFYRTAYEFDGVGRLKKLTYPSGRSVEYGYGSSSEYVYPRSMTVKDASASTLLSLTNMVHDVDGQLKSYDAGLMSFTASWNAAGEALTRDYDYNSTGRFAWDVSERDGNGNIEEAGDDYAGKELLATYDNYDRLLDAVGTNLRGYQNCEYGYDGAGNRTDEDCAYGGVGGKGASDGKPIVYTYNSVDDNLLESVSWDDGGAAVCGGGTVTRDFDRDTVGRATTAYLRKYPTASDAATLTYAAHGRVSSVNAPAGTFDYTYDARNLRKRKDGPSTDTWFVHDPSGRLLAEDSGTNGKDYVWVQGQFIAQIDGATSGSGGTVSIIGADHLGTPMRAWDTSGDPVWAADYEAFGAATEYLPGGGTPSTSVSIRFPGQYADAETGLHYNWHRYYDPSTGRYLTADPIVSIFPGHMEPVYGYALNNPVLFDDPKGLAVKRCYRIAENEDLNKWSFLHQWIQTDTRAAGQGDAGEAAGPYCGSTTFYTQVVDHSSASWNEKNSDIVCVEYQGVDEECVNNQLDKLGMPLGRWTFTNHCGSYVDSVFRKCGKCPKPKNWTPLNGGL